MQIASVLDEILATSVNWQNLASNLGLPSEILLDNYSTDSGSESSSEMERLEAASRSRLPPFSAFCGTQSDASEREDDGSDVEHVSGAFDYKQRLVMEYEEKMGKAGRRRKLSRLPLWYFLHELLLDESNQTLISWTDRANLCFSINKPKEMAELWGQLKKIKDMTYAKLARGIRYYYGKGFIEKEKGMQFCYRFVVSSKTRDVLCGGRKLENAAETERTKNVNTVRSDMTKLSSNIKTEAETKELNFPNQDTFSFTLNKFRPKIQECEEFKPNIKLSSYQASANSASIFADMLKPRSLQMLNFGTFNQDSTAIKPEPLSPTRNSDPITPSFYSLLKRGRVDSSNLIKTLLDFESSPKRMRRSSVDSIDSGLESLTESSSAHEDEDGVFDTTASTDDESDNRGGNVGQQVANQQWIDEHVVSQPTTCIKQTNIFCPCPSCTDIQVVPTDADDDIEQLFSHSPVDDSVMMHMFDPDLFRQLMEMEPGMEPGIRES